MRYDPVRLSGFRLELALNLSLSLTLVVHTSLSSSTIAFGAQSLRIRCEHKGPQTVVVRIGDDERKPEVHFRRFLHDRKP